MGIFKMKFRFGMIADDLTGANDSGIQLKEKGLNASVYFEIPEEHHSIDEAIVIDTNSRSLAQEDAYDVTKRAATFLAGKGYQHIYKKMDSTLRGYVGSELKAMDEVFNPDFVIVAPAFPAYGRVTHKGIHYMKGNPINETELANDPIHPITEAHIPTILEKETDQKVTVIDEVLLSQNEDDWLETLNGFIKADIKYLVCDASTEEELKEMAKKIYKSGYQVIWSGSAGLAEVLPSVLGVEGSSSYDEAKNMNKGPVLSVCGSLSQTTQEQVYYAIHQEGVQSIKIDTERIFCDDWEDYAHFYIDKAISHLNDGMDVILYVPSDNRVRMQVKNRASELGLNSFQIGERISKTLSRLTKEVLNLTSVSSLVLTGGDTAKDVAKKLGATGIRLRYELEAGVPVGELIGDLPSVTVITKAGAFGEVSTIYHGMQSLKGVVKNEQ